MGTTANFAWPYPELGDAPNVPLDMKELADAADSTVKTARTDLDKLMNPATCKMSKNVDQSIANNTVDPVKLTWQVKDYDSHTFASLTNNNFVVPTGFSGIWTLTLTVRWAASGESGSACVGRIRRNGVDIVTEQAPNMNSSQGSTSHSMSVELSCSVGDVFDAYVWQNSGAARSVTTNFGGTQFSARWVRKLIT